MAITLGALLEQRRTELRERQQDTAARFQISQPSYWRWENDQGFPNEAHFEAVADFVGIDVDQIHAFQRQRAQARLEEGLDDWQSDMTAWRQEIEETLRWQRSQLSRVERAIADLVNQMRWSDRIAAECQCSCHRCGCCDDDDSGSGLSRAPRGFRPPNSSRR